MAHRARAARLVQEVTMRVQLCDSHHTLNSTGTLVQYLGLSTVQVLYMVAR